jgi:hypothetical protein
MRLIRTSDLQLEEFVESDIPLYAILSHTWQGREVTLQEFRGIHSLSHKPISTPGLEKIKAACSVARQDGFEYIWIDTCCIDKTSSAELTEAVNSMYRWYQNSAVCYAYLADVSTEATDIGTWKASFEFLESRWFKRGWTLQELIAPSDVIFLDKEWKEIGTKVALQQTIADITSIPIEVLIKGNLDYASIAQKMAWASKRSTTRIEDMAYCLMGLFNIHMPMIYGEGENAFIRLQEEILKVSDDHTIFAWRSPQRYGASPRAASHFSGLLASSPAAFSESGSVVQSFSLSKAITINNKGIHVQVHLEEGVGSVVRAILPCKEQGKGDIYMAIYVTPVQVYDRPTESDWYFRAHCDKLELVKVENLKKSPFGEKMICIRHGNPPVTRKQLSHGGCALALDGLGAFTVDLNTIHLSPGWGIKGNYLTAPYAGLGPLGSLGQLLARLVFICKDGVLLQLTLRIFPSGLRVNTVVGGESDSSQWPDKGDRIIERLDDDRILSVAIRKKIPPIGLGLCDVVELKYTSPLITSNPDRWFDFVAVVGPHAVEEKLLHYAARHGLTPILKLALGKGSSILDRKNAEGATPLSLAAEHGQTEAVAFLLKQQNVDLNSKDINGRSALWRASGQGQTEIVKLLLEAQSIDPDLKDNHGQSPLASAVWNGHEDVVRVLLDSGRVNPISKDRIGRTPLWIAKQEDHPTVLKLLQDYKISRSFDAK